MTHIKQMSWTVIKSYENENKAEIHTLGLTKSLEKMIEWRAAGIVGSKMELQIKVLWRRTVTGFSEIFTRRSKGG